MKCILLAAGYATRLKPLTDRLPKPLLPVAGKPMLEHIYEKVQAVPEVDGVHVVTNHRYVEAFQKWAPAGVTVHDDGTTDNATRLGAIGDIAFTVERAGLQNDDLLIIAGDNLFEFSLGDYVKWWRERSKDEPASAIALFEEPDPELVKHYAVVAIDATQKVVAFEEKPKAPKTNLVSIATYIYHRAHVARVKEYLAGGGSPDQPGNLVAWLHTRAPVYGYRFPGAWLDIGTPAQLLEADNAWRARLGMPQRSTYEP